MIRAFAPSVILMSLAAGCSAPPANPPSLAPRPAEAIDPRVPIPSEAPVGPVAPALASRLAQLVAEARSGDAAFREAAAAAERLAAAAGAPHSEGWIAAQQAVSAAQAARAPTTRALGDIDSLAATALATRGGIPAGDLAAIRAAAADVAAIDQSQAERIDALQARLGA
jgi:hypothetical protein